MIPRLRGVRMTEIGDGATLVRTADGASFEFSADLPTTSALIGELLAVEDGPGVDGQRRRLIDLLVEHSSWATPSILSPAYRPASVAVSSRDVALGRALREACLASGVPVEDSVAGSPVDPSATGPGTMIVAVLDEDVIAGVREWAEVMASHAATWMPVWREEALVFVGPVMSPDGALGGSDLVFRLLANRRADPAPSGGRTVGQVGLTAAELAWTCSTIALYVERAAAGIGSAVEGHLVELNCARMSVTPHPVLPHPLSRGPAPRPSGPAALESVRTGIVRSVRRVDHHPSIPPSLRTFHARNTDLKAVSPWRNDPTTAGTSFRSGRDARAAAVGEAVERYCCDVVDADSLVSGSWQDLTDSGEQALDPDRLVLYSPEQHAARGFPFVPLDRRTAVYWTSGRSLTRGVPVRLPASLVYGNWYNDDYSHTPRTNNTFFPGIAAGRSPQHALTAAVLELIERHATMVWWADGRVLPELQQTSRLRALWDCGGPAVGRQRRWLLSIPNEFGIPVVAGVVENLDENLLTVGFAARPTVEAAAEKAWAEALTLQDGARDLQRPDGGYWQSADRGEVLATHMKPWREDRRYLDSYRGDFHDVVDLMSHLQISLDPRAVERSRSIVEPAGVLEPDDVAVPGESSWTCLRETVEGRGYEILVADVTTLDVRSAGLRVVRALVPGLVPNYAAGLPFLGRGRVQAVPVELGWRPAPRPVSQLNHFPMPHA